MKKITKSKHKKKTYDNHKKTTSKSKKSVASQHEPDYNDADDQLYDDYQNDDAQYDEVQYDNTEYYEGDEEYYEDDCQGEDDLVMLDLEDFDTFESYNNDEPPAPANDYIEPDDEIDDKSPVNIMAIISAILLIAIIMLLIIGGIKIYQWQKGKDLVVSEGDLLEDYATESEDWYVYFDPTDDPNFVDDGDYNILILGDSLIYDYNDDTSIQAQIAANTGANVTALGLPYTTIGLHNPTFSQDYPEDAYSLYYLAYDITAGDMGNYDLQMTAWEYMEDYGVYYKYWDVLHKIDFDDIDVLIICYNYDDFRDGIRFTGDDVYSLQEYGSLDSYNSALSAALKLFKERFPHMQIIVSSPSFFMVDNDGEMIGGDLYNNGSGNLGEYVVNMKGIANDRNVSFVDNYFGVDFSCDNYEMYLEEDMIHPNELGRKLIADHITEFIYFMRTSNITINN